MNGNQIREGLAHAEYLRVKALENRIAELEGRNGSDGEAERLTILIRKEAGSMRSAVLLGDDNTQLAECIGNSREAALAGLWEEFSP